MGVRGRRKKEVLTESKIQEILDREYAKRTEYQLENLYVFDWESDYLIKTKAGYWYEFEIKISLSDFKNDKKNKKKKFDLLESKDENKLCPNYFSYCVPKELTEKVKDFLPSYAGLYEISEHFYPVQIKAPEKINNRKMTDEDLNLTKKFYYNYKSWKDKVDKNFVEDLKGEINFLRAEFKAVAGYDIREVL